MSEELKVETAQEENFAELLEQSLKTLNNGDKVTGTVMAIGSTEIEVDLGTKHTAYIPLEDFSGDPSVKPEDVVHVGDQIEAIVVHVNDGEGVVLLFRKRLAAGCGLEVVDVNRLLKSFEAMQQMTKAMTKGKMRGMGSLMGGMGGGFGGGSMRSFGRKKRLK